MHAFHFLTHHGHHPMLTLGLLFLVAELILGAWLAAKAGRPRWLGVALAFFLHVVGLAILAVMAWANANGKAEWFTLGYWFKSGTDSTTGA